ncbi:RING finger protein 24-like [Haliotis rufescens]|uniref:RING finger protein 24-like n=1 Tax=Haliotis rufescens TaxID=6454 RepID=UPI001EB09E3A|nr:RING finger protein 24-like [Haliotis rufescens]
MNMSQIPFNVSLPLLGVGVMTLLLSLLFCCYMWKLKRDGRRARGYRNIRTVKVKKKAETETCAVCLEEFKYKETLAICPCKHKFHQKCLTQWLQHRNICPMCKAKVQYNAGETTSLIEGATPL